MATHYRENVARVFPFRNRGDRQPGYGFCRKIFQAVNGDIDPPGKQLICIAIRVGGDRDANTRAQLHVGTA